MLYSELGLYKLPDITVITCTNRWGGIDILKASLQRQTFTNFEALIIDEKYIFRSADLRLFLADDHRFRHICSPPMDKDDFWNLNKSMNYGLSIAQGKLIVLLQDYIWLPDDALEKFWRAYESLGDVLISGVGHKAQWPNWAVNLFGKVTIFTHSGFQNVQWPEDKPEDGYRKPEGVFARDPRIQGRGLHLCNPIEWEANWACFPASVSEKIGGFDEDFDKGRGFDNTNFAERAQLAGFQVWLDETNECVGYSHELLFKNDQDDCAQRHHPNNMELWRSKCEKLQRKEIDYKVPFLDNMKQGLFS